MDRLQQLKLLLSLVLGLVIFSTIQAQHPANNTITTFGEAIVYAAPDEIFMDINISVNDPDIVAAKSQNNELSSRAIKFLKSNGVKEQHIQTQYLYVRAIKKHRSPNVDYYSASQTIAVCIQDIDKYENIVDGLLASGITGLGSPRFRNTAMRRHKDEARVKAVVAAREKAELMAKALGQSIGKAVVIKEVKDNYYVQPSAYANTVGNDAGASSAGEASFAPGQLEVRATVEVSFALQ